MKLSVGDDRETFHDEDTGVEAFDDSASDCSAADLVSRRRSTSSSSVSLVFLTCGPGVVTSTNRAWFLHRKMSSAWMLLMRYFVASRATSSGREAHRLVKSSSVWRPRSYGMVMPTLALMYGYTSPSNSRVEYHGGISRLGGIGDTIATVTSAVKMSWSCRMRWAKCDSVAVVAGLSEHMSMDGRTRSVKVGLSRRRRARTRLASMMRQFVS